MNTQSGDLLQFEIESYGNTTVSNMKSINYTTPVLRSLLVSHTSIWFMKCMENNIDSFLDLLSGLWRFIDAHNLFLQVWSQSRPGQFRPSNPHDRAQLTWEMLGLNLCVLMDDIFSILFQTEVARD